MDHGRSDRWQQDLDLLRVLDDLEQQAAGLHLVERESEVADLAAVEYAEVDLEARLRGSLGTEVAVRLRGGQHPRGRVARVGAGWLVLTGPSATRWLVSVPAVTALTGVGQRAAHPSTRSVADTLPLRALLRRQSEDPAQVGSTAHLVDGTQLQGRLVRVGADFVEVAGGTGGTTLVPLAALAAVRWSA